MALRAPIPGMSLTQEVGGNPWQQPPLYNTPAESLAFYFKKMDNPDVVDDMMFTLSHGFPLSLLVDSLTSAGVMNGFHTVDVKMLISPVLHEHIKALAEAVGIDIREDDGPTAEEKAAKRDKERIKFLIKKSLSTPVDKKKLDIQEAKQEMADQGQETPQEDAAEAPTPSPLIKRRG